MLSLTEETIFTKESDAAHLLSPPTTKPEGITFQLANL